MPRFALFAFLLPCLAHGPAITNASLCGLGADGSVNHFENGANEVGNLLFWSTFDFSIDAAVQYLGPVDGFIRRAPAQNCLNPHDIAAVACLEPAPRFGELIDSVDGIVGTVVKNLSMVFNKDNVEAGPRTTDLPKDNKSTITITVPRGGGSGGLKTHQKYSLFQKGDGSQTDPEGIPLRYLAMQNGNREMAKKALAATLQWRKENDVDNILFKPQTKFDIAKEVFPHVFLGRDKKGDIVFLQRPALIDLAKAERNGLTKEDLLMHYVYVIEYLWQILEGHKPVGTITGIIDLTGLQLGVLRKREMIQFLKIFVQTMDQHFPQRAHKTLLLNAPKWFNTLYKLLSPLLRESTKARIEIHSRGRRQDEALRKYLTSEETIKSLPASFWSSYKTKRKGSKKMGADEEVEIEPAAVFHSKLEEDLRAYTIARLRESGKKMLPVL